MDNNINTSTTNQTNTQNNSNSNSDVNYDYDTSKTAFIIKGVAICFFIADIFAVLIFSSYGNDSLVTFLLVAISVFSFLLIYGFGEIINLLYEINKKLK